MIRFRCISLIFIQLRGPWRGFQEFRYPAARSTASYPWDCKYSGQRLEKRVFCSWRMRLSRLAARHSESRYRYVK